MSPEQERSVPNYQQRRAAGEAWRWGRTGEAGRSSSLTCTCRFHHMSPFSVGPAAPQDSLFFGASRCYSPLPLLMAHRGCRFAFRTDPLQALFQLRHLFMLFVVVWRYMAMIDNGDIWQMIYRCTLWTSQLLIVGCRFAKQPGVLQVVPS